MSTNNKGIDYGMGQTNRDPKSGIRYGVISQNEVLQAWADESEAVYPCEVCEVPEDERECGGCDFCEPESFVYTREGYKAQSDSYGDIFVIESPYFTYAQFCSPCAPGACHLGNPLESPDEDNRAFCFGHDWFEDERAPYPVFEVETGRRVRPTPTTVIGDCDCCGAQHVVLDSNDRCRDCE